MAEASESYHVFRAVVIVFNALALAVSLVEVVASLKRFRAMKSNRSGAEKYDPVFWGHLTNSCQQIVRIILCADPARVFGIYTVVEYKIMLGLASIFLNLNVVFMCFVVVKAAWNIPVDKPSKWIIMKNPTIFKVFQFYHLFYNVFVVVLICAIQKRWTEGVRTMFVLSLVVFICTYEVYFLLYFAMYLKRNSSASSGVNRELVDKKLQRKLFFKAFCFALVCLGYGGALIKNCAEDFSAGSEGLYWPDPADFEVERHCTLFILSFIVTFIMWVNPRYICMDLKRVETRETTRMARGRSTAASSKGSAGSKEMASGGSGIRDGGGGDEAKDAEITDV